MRVPSSDLPLPLNSIPSLSVSDSLVSKIWASILICGLADPKVQSVSSTTAAVFVTLEELKHCVLDRPESLENEPAAKGLIHPGSRSYPTNAI